MEFRNDSERFAFVALSMVRGKSLILYEIMNRAEKETGDSLQFTKDFVNRLIEEEILIEDGMQGGRRTFIIDKGQIKNTSFRDKKLLMFLRAQAGW